ncbi:MAG: spore germination protein GerW family protein [Dehalococcoidia bacterium]|nr:spore germination protein GerW family protein [Dehalococcoidia bacterium]MDD5648489.1 spore germination protein GerW family protein [Dehalococcoidia bacterium]
MEDIENMVRTTISQIEKVLSSKTVIGEPITLGETTLIPLLSMGFGFGAAGGVGKTDAKQSGDGLKGGTGGAGGMRPIAIIVIDKEGVRIEPIKSSVAAALEKLGEKVPGVVEKIADRWGERKKE